jgi:two-component system OmpR family response regulator/two-component system copper resistance phosphate regulon response regulator CusR
MNSHLSDTLPPPARDRGMDILIIEDDPVIGKALQKGLREAGHDCLWIKDGVAGLEAAQSQKHDVMILDLLVPGESGLNILEKLRKEGIQTPVLILTALGSVDDRVTGLRKGADDYLVKPFAMTELLARVEALNRRSTIKPSVNMEVGPLTLDLATRRVTSSGVDVDLTPTEFSILEMLMRHTGQVVTRTMLCESLWESDWEGTTNVIEVHINRLRTKLQRGTKEPLIHTVRGRGYVLRAGN